MHGQTFNLDPLTIPHQLQEICAWFYYFHLFKEKAPNANISDVCLKRSQSGRMESICLLETLLVDTTKSSNIKPSK